MSFFIYCISVLGLIFLATIILLMFFLLIRAILKAIWNKKIDRMIDKHISELKEK